MKVHEYQAKQLLAERGITVPAGRVATTVAEAVGAVAPLVAETGNPVVVVKAQIHAGGRGKGRFQEYPEVAGVEVVTAGIGGGTQATEARVAELAERMLGSTLVTVQTGPDGKQVNRLYVEQGIDIARELYLAVLLDRALGRNVVMASTEGGTDIEEVAAATPERIVGAVIDPAIGLARFQAAELAHLLGLEGEAGRNAVVFMQALAAAATELDTDLIEINPLVVTADGEVMALDGKMSFDANALYRHPDVQAMRDESEEDPAELEAAAHGLSYVKMDGTIGCMVNGAGLAMSTMDIIKYVGGEPANFLDVGGGATAERVSEAFKLILTNDSVEAILVNIFGGIVRCDLIAEGIISAVKEVGVEVPVIARLEGTNVKKGRKLLEDSQLAITAASDLTDAARKAVAAVA